MRTRTESLKKPRFLYENGITDYLKELSGDKNITAPVYF